MGPAYDMSVLEAGQVVLKPLSSPDQLDLESISSVSICVGYFTYIDTD